MFSLKIIILTVAIGYITAFPSGAPANICGRYVPGGHRNSGTPVANGPRTGPYKLDVIPNGNGQFTVTLSSTTSLPFKGYVIQALPSWKELPDGPSDIVGSFQPDFQNGQYQVRSCGPMGGSNVLTHTSKVNKTRVSATWQAPRNLPDPNVKFVATVIQNLDYFYVIHSSPVNTQGGSTGGSSGAGSFSSGAGMGIGTSGQGFSSGGQSFNNAGQGFGPTTGQGLGGSSGFSTTVSTGLSSSFGGASSNTGAESNDPLGGGIPVISDAPRPIQLFTPDPPPPFVLPNGKVSIHSFDNSATSVPISSENTSSSSSFSTSFITSSGQTSFPQPTINSAIFSSTIDNTFDVAPTSSSITSFTSSSMNSGNTFISSPTMPSLSSSLSSMTSPVDATSLPTLSSLTATVSKTTDGSQDRAVETTFSQTNGLNMGSSLETSSNGASTSFSASETGLSNQQPPVPSPNVIDITTSDIVTGSGSTNQAFDTTNILTDLPPDTSGPLNIEIPPERPNDPIINIIEIPILPEGQTAALLNITNGEVTPSSVRRLQGIPLFIGPRLASRRAANAGMTQGQGQSGFGQGQMTSTFGQTRPPFTAGGSPFNSFGGSFGRPGGSQISGPGGMTQGGMFGGSRFSGAGSFGGFPGGRPMGPFGAGGPGMFSSAGGMPFGPGSAGGSTFGGQQTTRQASGTAGMPGGQTTSFGGQSSFGGESTMFGGQGESPFGGQTMFGGRSTSFGPDTSGPFGPQFGGGPFGGPGPFGGSSGMFRGRTFGPGGPFSDTSRFGGPGSPFGSPMGPFASGPSSFGGSAGQFGGMAGQTFTSFSPSGPGTSFGTQFGTSGGQGTSAGSGAFGSQFGSGIPQGPSQTSLQGQTNSQSMGMFGSQGLAGAGAMSSAGSSGFSSLGQGTSSLSSSTGSGSAQTFGASGQGSSGLSAFSFGG